jgi:starvation-inducible DNA-binding protein
MPNDTRKAVGELLAPMLKKTLFVAINHVAASASEIEPFVAEHLAYRNALEAEGRLWASGPFIQEGVLVGDGDQIFAMTDDIAERARKIGGATLRSIGDISRNQRLEDNDKENITPRDMLAELGADNQALARYFRSAHESCEKYNDVANASMIEVWIDQTERRTWFLAEIVQGL